MAESTQAFVGFGVYVKGEEPGALHAQWGRSDRISSAPEKAMICGGTARGGPANGFAGSYLIIYTDEQGKPGAAYKLTIKPAGETYQLKWEKDDQTPYVGVGMELDGKLVFGWAPNPG